MRLIDADWVLAHLKPYEPSDEEWGVTGGTALRLIHNAVDNAPTVDAIPVVRCKDCKYSGVYSTGNLYCMHQGGMLPSTPSDFCCHGELRKDDDECG